MQNSPLVSIIIPVYNRQNIIRDALFSSTHQTYPNIEIIIVDNNSTDSTWSVLEQEQQLDSRIRIYRNEYNIGPVLNWCKCFEQCKGDYIKILWSDDWMDLDFIENSIRIFDKDTAFVMSSVKAVDSCVGGNIIWEKNYNRKVISTHSYLRDMIFYDKYPFSPGCTIMRTIDVKQYFDKQPIINDDGLNSLHNGAGNDLQLMMNISSAYKEIKILPNCYSYFRHHEKSISVQDNKIMLYYFWVYYNYLTCHSNSTLMEILCCRIKEFSSINNVETQLLHKVSSISPSFFSRMLYLLSKYYIFVYCHLAHLLKAKR